MDTPASISIGKCFVFFFFLVFNTVFCRMQAHVAKQHRVSRIRLCNCEIQQKYCSKVIAFCHQILMKKVWQCVAYSPPVTEVQAIVSQPRYIWDGPYRQPKFRIVYKGLPYEKIYCPPPMLSPIPDSPVQTTSSTEEDYISGISLSLQFLNNFSQLSLGPF